jgi:hypothetical protein
MNERNTHASTHHVFVLRALIAAFFFACLGSAGHAQGSRQVVRTPLERDGAGMLIVKVKLSAHQEATPPREFRFVLDTGASRSVVDTELPSAFGVTIPASIPSKVRDSTERSVAMDRVKLAWLKIGDQIRENLVVYRMDLKHSFLASHQDEPVDGILGMDVLRGARFVIDPHRREIRWGDHLEGTRVPIGYDSHGRPALAVKLEDAEICCYLDTGARSAFRMIGNSREGQASTPFFFQGLSGKPKEGKRIRVERLAVGSQAWQRVPLELVPSGEAGNHLGRGSLGPSSTAVRPTPGSCSGRACLCRCGSGNPVL